MKAQWPTVAIVGVGMIGGSIGKALLARRLTEAGFVADTTGWQMPQAADLEAELDLLAGVHGAPMKRL